MPKKNLIFAAAIPFVFMEKLDFQAIADNRDRFHFNDQIALFSDFAELRSRALSEVLIDGFLFAVVTNGQAQLSVDDKNYLLKVGDVITCKPRMIFEKSLMSIDFNAVVLFLSPEYVARLSQMIRMEWTYSMFSSSHRILHADEIAVRRYCLYFDLLKNHLSSPETPHFLRRWLTTSTTCRGFRMKRCCISHTVPARTSCACSCSISTTLRSLSSMSTSMRACSTLRPSTSRAFANA